MSKAGGIYPYLRCGRHHEQLRLGYCVCVHVANEGAEVESFVRATTTEAGQVLCGLCVHIVPPTVEKLLAVCELCVQEITRR